MTYSDVITLLLCFFAVFLSISIPRKEVPPKLETAQPVPAPVRQVLVLDGRLPFRTRAGDRDRDRDDAPPVPGDASRAAPAAAIVPPPELAPAVAAAAAIEPKGDRITMLELGSAAFFDSGSATLSASGEQILSNVAAQLASGAFDDYQVTVEGHTDDTPIRTVQFPSNWELSTARASAVVHFLLEHGIPAQRLRAAGYADSFPRAPNRDASGHAVPENQAQNRRVVIRLEKIETQQKMMTR